MRNIKLTIEYDGTNFAGWQVQNSRTPHAARRTPKTIQEAIEKALQKILQKRVKIIGSGRTDAGVHAKAQIANFNTDSGIAIDKLRAGLNAVLPDDISVIKAEEVGLDFHSRFSAQSKVYRYTILNRPSRPAILKHTVYFFSYPLNLRRIRKEARTILGRHDFKSFQAADKKERNPVKTIKKINISRESDFIYIDIEADGFLYNMARNIVGTLVKIGTGRLPEGSMDKIMRAKNRKFAGPTAPAKGLCLLEVKY